MSLGDYDCCGNIRKSDSDYCNDHACSAPRCDGIQGTNGSYCIKHGCVMPVPVSIKEPADNESTDKTVDSKSTDKTVDSKSAIPAMPTFSQKKKPPALPDHKRTKQVTCGAQISKGKHCKEHACARRECEKGIMERGLYCEMHGCMVLKDEIPCGNMRTRDGCCEEHACAYEDCGFPRESMEFCKNHRCKVDACNNYNECGNYCAIHTCKKCDRRCGTSGPYCEKHGCRAEVPNGICGMQRIDKYHLCAAHKCNSHGCGKEAYNGYCKGHKCKVNACNNYNECRNYCAIHTCKKCDKRQTYGRANYCGQCICHRQPCLNLRSTGRRCSTHSHLCDTCLTNKRLPNSNLCDPCERRQQHKETLRRLDSLSD